MTASMREKVGEPGAEDLKECRDLAVEGRMLDAYACTSRFAPFEAWTSPEACRTAAWLCEALGAPRRARASLLRAIRRWPSSPLARLMRLQMIFERRGPLATWEALEQTRPLLLAAGADEQTDLRLAEASVLATFRDFDRALSSVAEAERLGGSARRVALVRARVLADADRYAEALASAEAGLAAAPSSPDAIAAVAHLRVLVGDDSGALAILRDGAARTQSADLALRLAGALDERKLHDERREWIEVWAERAPLLEDTGRLAMLRADCAFDRGDLAAALEGYRAGTSPFHRRVAEPLARALQGGPAEHALLDVPFVRQHHMTCVPATLTMLARFWGHAASHVEIAATICYDGTPHHSQRAWAEANGFEVREFTADVEITRALVSRGVPFAVSTFDATSGHLQAIIGFDDRRGTLFLRDPFVPQTIEALAAEWLATWKATGPHAMAMVPVAERARLDGLVFPEEAWCRALHQVSSALERHDRAAAGTACDLLALEAPGHRLAVAARRAVAAYDQDLERVLACARETATAYPDAVAARLEALACMRAVRPRAERIAEAEGLVAGNGREPLFGEALARELIDDAREHPRAARHLRASIRARPGRHQALALLAEIGWSRGRFDETLSLRRLTACLGRFDEHAAREYFEAARALGRESEALAWLEARAADLGRRSAGPLHTLFWALESLGRGEEGMRAIDAAVGVRPDDGELLLLAADAHGRIGEAAAASDLLERAAANSKRSEWLRAASKLALRTGRPGERRKWLEELLEIEPLDAQAHVTYAQALAAGEGPPAARAHLERTWRQFPHVRGLAHVLLEWLASMGPAEVERVADAALAIDPADAWIHRERALALATQGRVAEAQAALDLAEALEPRSASLECVRAALARRQGRPEDAQSALFAALDLDPDRGDVAAAILGHIADGGERAAALEAVARTVHLRSVTGGGIVAWYLAARGVHDPRELLATLDALRERRGELWVTWTCAIKQRTALGDHEESIELGRQACARFPLVVGAWVELADALSAAARDDEAIAPLERAVALGGEDVAAPARLAAAYARSGNSPRAREVLKRAIARSPSSRPLRLQDAELAWGAGDRAAAIAGLEAVLDLDPTEEQPWTTLEAWTADEAGASNVVARIERLCEARPWSAHAALNLAKARARRSDLKGALAALDRALALDELLVDAHDFRAVVLAVDRRFDEAARACSPARYGARVPRELRGRAAWVRARRGELERACAEIRDLLAEHPDYTWGWSQLVEWCAARGAPEEKLEACKRLVATAPRAAFAQVELAGALFEAGDRGAAKEALARAIALAPTDPHPAQQLFDAALEDGELERAAAAVLPLRAARGAAGSAAEVRLLTRRGDADGAIAGLRALALDPGADTGLIQAAHRACVLAGLAERCDEELSALLERPEVHAGVGAVWARARVADDPARVVRAMEVLDPTLAGVRAAAREWLSLLAQWGDVPQRRRAAQVVRDRFRPCDDELWAGVAATLASAGDFTSCAAWTSDWRSRPAAPAWMLQTAAAARREIASDEEAFAIVQRAAGLPEDAATRSHRTWLAFELAMRGDTREARRWLLDAGDLSEVPLLVGVASLTEAALVVQEARGGLAAFGRAREKLRGSAAQRRFGVFERAHARARLRVARDVGFPIGTLWRSGRDLGVVGVVMGFAVLAVLLIGAGGGSAVAPMVWGAVIVIRSLAKRSQS